jgi:hypothetical protein
LGESCGYPSPGLIPRCPISLCVCFSHLDLDSSLRRNNYWMCSSFSIGTLSTPFLFHCSNMFGRSIPSLSTMSLRSGSFVPTSLGFISMSSSASYMGLLASLVSLTIGVALPPPSHILSWAICVLICFLVPGFFSFFLLLSSFFPFIGLVPSFCSILGLQIAPC